jgi:hypothetical protein
MTRREAENMEVAQEIVADKNKKVGSHPLSLWSRQEVHTEV